ncbi:MAG: TonB-dependent receptor [Pseudoalteromonas sp.]|nr:TonB-dependent receptor [Pseudoalteromonas sp.]
MTNSHILRKSALTIALSLALPSAFAQGAKSDEASDELEHIQILSHYDKLRTEAGSATLLTEADLEKFEYDDIHRILSKVPGVNIREEDGYGLRPNIGFRGVTPERSKKITILEDGILIGPSPYSAPAAYYFPVSTRMTAVEVFKGPAAIKYGPQTVAGTINLVTRAVPEFSEGGIDVAFGSDGYQKVHGHFGSVVNNVGFLVEGVSLKADGFKELDGGGDTGFEKNDILAKFNYQLSNNGIDHKFGLKLSYADEQSDETYLGLTETDFAENPYRRYAATQPALMDTKHQQIMFSHNLEFNNLSVTTRLYRNDYERAWLKLNGLLDRRLSKLDATLSGILADPQKYELEYAVISGQQDSLTEGQPEIYLNMGTNDRAYFSQGLQIDSTYEFSLFDLNHKLSAGIRFHQDEIERKHFEETYGMRAGKAFDLGQDIRPTTQNVESTDAWSVYLEDQVTVDALTLGLGVRGELMKMHHHEKGEETNWLDKTTRIWLPGLSGFYKLNEESGLLFGVHQGFVPSSPAQTTDVELEKSVNYEFGGRFNDGVTQVEVVSFFNNYSNLKESCGFSNCGVDQQLDQEFNGGKVDVYGLETQFAQTYPLNLQVDIPYSFVYTYTRGEFKNSFKSDFAQWGDVEVGDTLPYLPEHQASFNIGLETSNWALTMTMKYVGSMKEVAGDGQELSGFKVPATTTVDVSASYDFDKYGRIYAKIDNLLDEAKIVSRRPYGARPGKPRQFSIGYKYQF